MIRPATVQDIPQLKKIWERTFDDPLDYIGFLYDKFAKPEDTLVNEEDGQIVSMAMSVMCSFAFKGQEQKCVYIYGVATLPGYEWQREQMILITRIEREAAEQGAQMSVIIPGTRMLYSYYRKHGYTSEFPIRNLTLKPGVLGAVDIQGKSEVYNRISNEELYRIREEALYAIPHIRWEPKRLDKMTVDALSYNEKLASYSGEEGDSYCIYSMRSNHMYIRECLGTTDESVRLILALVIDRNNPSRVHMRLPVDGGFLPYEGRKAKMGLGKLFQTAKNLTDFAPYMNLMFD